MGSTAGSSFARCHCATSRGPSSNGLARVSILRIGNRRNRFERRRHVKRVCAPMSAAAFSKHASLRVTLRECVEAIVRHLDAAFVRIWTLNRDQETLVLQASAGMYTHLDGPHSRIPIGELKIGLIAEEKKPHLTNDVLNDSRVSHKEWAQKEGMVSFTGFPLTVEDRVVGVVAMFARERLCRRTYSIRSPSVADLIAQSIERKRAEEELRESQALLRMRAEQALEEAGLRLAAQSRVLTELTATQARSSVQVGQKAPRHPRIVRAGHSAWREPVSGNSWRVDPAIRCVDLFESTPARHTSGVCLQGDRYPEYFAALDRERLIAAGDAHVDERTREFSSDYLLHHWLDEELNALERLVAEGERWSSSLRLATIVRAPCAIVKSR